MRRLLLLAAVAGFVLPPPATGAEPYRVDGDHVPGEVIVRYRAGVGAAARSAVEAASGTVSAGSLPGGSRRLRIGDASSVRDTVSELRGDPRVAYAVPNFVARAAAFLPNDRGFPLQWNFWGPFGINMPEAWSLAQLRGAPGGRGAVVAVLDTGLAYRNLGRFRRAPDLGAVVRGYDFVDDDRFPLDPNGHGTHVAGTVAESTNNRIGASGIAYGARIMPLRALDATGAGDAVAISRAVRFAVRRRADVINLSLEFPPFVGAADIPELTAALRLARRRGVVVTAVAGNDPYATRVPYPARARGAIAVAATTASGCQAHYSTSGSDVDVAAPGGGDDAAPGSGDPWGLAHCSPGLARPSIYQQTLTTDLRRFGLPDGYHGTSMAAPHVAGLAALLLASERLGPDPRPGLIERHIEATARDLGPPGFDVRYGHGLIDAAAALR